MYPIILALLRLATEVIKLLTAVLNRRKERDDSEANSEGFKPEGKHFRHK